MTGMLLHIDGGKHCWFCGFGTWQNRLPQQLRLASLSTFEQANAFLREHYIAEFNRRFAKPAEAKGTAFRKCGRKGSGSGVLRTGRACSRSGQHRRAAESLP